MPLSCATSSLRDLLAELQQESRAPAAPPACALRWDVRAGACRAAQRPGEAQDRAQEPASATPLKYTQRGRIVVRVALRSARHALEFTVADTGIGIAPEHAAEHLRHVPAGGRSASAQGGVGLGLYIVKRLVEQLGGPVTVSSEPGQGSTFRVSLPALSAAEPAQAEPHAHRPHLVA